MAKKYYCKLIDKDLYCKHFALYLLKYLDYKNKNDNFHTGIYNLSGVSVTKLNNLTVENQLMYSFSLSVKNEAYIYLCDNEEQYNRWIESLKNVTGFFDLNDTYEIKEKLGQGKFGLVKLCVHKKTKREAAIKIISKKEMKERDYEQTRNEIEILKVCQHPNIMTLYDIFENNDYYYISKLYFKKFSNGAMFWR